MTNRTLKNASTMLLGSALAVFAASCDDPLEPEEHPEAGGVVIIAEGTGIVLSRSVGANAAFDNPLIVPLNGALEVEVLFLDEAAPTDLTRAFAPDEDEGESLRVNIANETVAGFEFHGDHADFEGTAAGTTTASFDLMHGGHADFESGNLTIIVQ